MDSCECGKINLKNISIPSLFFVNEENLNTDIPIGLVDNFEDIIELYPDIEDMSLDESEEIEKKFKENNKIIFNPVIKIKCQKCGKESIVGIDYRKIISKFEIKNIFEQYLDITQFTNMNKTDVDTMLPFEREIFIGLIQERENKKG
jgi:hypothetical protein